jgi:lysozyme
VKFNAIDFIVRGSPVGPTEWANALRQMRSAGRFKGGIGTYPGFVHVDTRGSNADWNG